jgi:hypothetical protein
LQQLLADSSANEFEYGVWQNDDESVFFVSATAAEALAKLGYAEDSAAVFETARVHGIGVKKTTNRP